MISVSWWNRIIQADLCLSLSKQHHRIAKPGVLLFTRLKISGRFCWKEYANKRKSGHLKLLIDKQKGEWVTYFTFYFKKKIPLFFSDLVKLVQKKCITCFHFIEFFFSPYQGAHFDKRLTLWRRWKRWGLEVTLLGQLLHASCGIRKFTYIPVQAIQDTGININT